MCVEKHELRNGWEYYYYVIRVKVRLRLVSYCIMLIIDNSMIITFIPIQNVVLFRNALILCQFVEKINERKIVFYVREISMENRSWQFYDAKRVTFEKFDSIDETSHRYVKINKLWYYDIKYIIIQYYIQKRYFFLTRSLCFKTLRKRAPTL